MIIKIIGNTKFRVPVTTDPINLKPVCESCGMYMAYDPRTEDTTWLSIHDKWHGSLEDLIRDAVTDTFKAKSPDLTK